MVQVSKLSIIALFFLVFVSPGFSGGLNFRTGYFGNQHIMQPHYKFGYPAIWYGHIPKHILKHHRPWKHPKNPYRLIYDPRSVSYGFDQSEKTQKVEVNINVIEEKGTQPNEHHVKKDKPIPKPHIVTLPDIDPAEIDRYIKSAKRPSGVILIRGTHVSETRTATD
jgi:CxxC motif-containing protein